MLTRYLVAQNMFKKPSKVLRTAFLPRPNPNTQSLETSVFRIDGIDINTAKIWENAPKNVHHVFGRADIEDAAVTKARLEVEIDNIPPNHANIIGWSNDEVVRTIMADELANAAILVLKPE